MLLGERNLGGQPNAFTSHRRGKNADREDRVEYPRKVIVHPVEGINSISSRCRAEGLSKDRYERLR